MQISSWMLSGARQARRIKEMYLKAVLRQNVAFFDIASTSGELSTGVNEDAVRHLHQCCQCRQLRSLLLFHVRWWVELGELLAGSTTSVLQVAVQNAIGEKVGNTLHNAATFVTGIIIAFVRGYLLTFVMLALVPIMALLGFSFASVGVLSLNSNLPLLAHRALCNHRWPSCNNTIKRGFAQATGMV